MNKTFDATQLDQQLNELKLTFTQQHYQDFAQQAHQKGMDAISYLAQLMDGETALRRQRAIQRRIRLARFPVSKRLDQFDWTWPNKINREQIQYLFHLKFLENHSNVIFLGGVGLGKSHLSTALGYRACEKGHSVLFASAIDIINALMAAQTCGRLKLELKRYLKPQILIMDELGYLPIDKTGADLLFQVISQRYERGSTIISTNRPYKKWPEIFNNDATLTSAILDRLLHHAETVVIQGRSYRMKEKTAQY